MSAIPVIRGGLQALYPVTATYHFDTFVAKNQDGSETRSVRSCGLVKFNLSWGALGKTDKDTLKTLVTTAKGRFDATASLTFRGKTYTNLALDSDVFEAVESPSINYETKLTFVQTLSQDLSPGTLGQAFPNFRSGVISHIPWTQRKRFSTELNTQYGPRFPWANYGAGLTNFPTDGLMGWQVGGESLSDSEVDALVAHFIANYGRYGDFTYTDEDGTTYSKTHYASDDLVITFKQPNEASCSVGLEVTF
jgi:hypothetical protein